MQKLQPAFRGSLVPTVDGLTWMQSVVSTRRLSVRQCSGADAKRFASNNRILTAFVWKTKSFTEAPQKVYLVGTFDNFKKHPLSTTVSGTFATVLEIPPGIYYYRFLVGDIYEVCEDDDNLIEDEETGDHYHELIVSNNVDHESREKNAFKSDITKCLVNMMEQWPQDGKVKKFRSSVVFDVGKHDNEETAANYDPNHPAVCTNQNKPLRICFPDGEEFYNECNKTQEAAAKNLQQSVEDSDYENECVTDEEVIQNAKKMQRPFYLDSERNAMERMLAARALSLQGDFEASVAMYGLVIRLREKYGLRRTQANVQAHIELASALLKLGQYKVADVHLTLAKEIWDENQINFLEADRMLYVNIIHMLGFTHDKLKKYDMAEFYYQDCIRLYRKFGYEGPNLRLAIKSLNKTIEILREKGIKLGRRAPPNRGNDRRFIKEASLLISRENNIFLDSENKSPNLGAFKNNERKEAAAPTIENVKTWAELATVARNSMRASKNIISEKAKKSTKTSETEAHAIQWQLEAIKAMHRNDYDEALDILTLAKYSRVQHGPWYTIECFGMLRDLAYVNFRKNERKEAKEQMEMAKEVLVMLEKTAKDRMLLPCDPSIVARDTTFEELKAGLLMLEGDILKVEKPVEAAERYSKALQLIDPSRRENPTTVVDKARRYCHA